MTKVLEFTTEQKSLIWTTKVAHTGATPDDAAAFVMVCEENGLNPLTGDVVFKRYEGKNGPSVSYIVTRDGLLKHVYRQDDFVSINAGVVRQGDHFKFDLNNEVIEHDFNSERGPVIGAWAVLKTKSRGNTMDFVDYSEYRDALGPKNDLWYNMPSAMIKKVAQSMVIRLAFPLGVQFQSEDEMPSGDSFVNAVDDQTTSNEVSMTSVLEKSKEEVKASTIDQPSKSESTKPVQPPEKNQKTKEVESESEIKEESEVPSIKEQTKEESASNGKEPATESLIKRFEEEVQEAPEKEVIPSQNDDGTYEFIKAELRASPSSGEQFLNINAKKNGSIELLFATDGLIFEFDEFEAGVRFEAKVKEQSGFKFVESVKVVA
jgi:phage recombination protein Bet